MGAIFQLWDVNIKHLCSSNVYQHNLYNLACLVLLKELTKFVILSCLSDFKTCNARFNVQSKGVHISASEHCRKIKFSKYVHKTLMSTKCEQCYA